MWFILHLYWLGFYQDSWIYAIYFSLHLEKISTFLQIFSALISVFLSGLWHILIFHWCYLHVFNFFSLFPPTVSVWIFSTEQFLFLPSVVLICYQASSMNFNTKRHCRFLVLEFSFGSLESFHFLIRNILIISTFQKSLHVFTRLI